eukprot:jgi/Tetstr1/427299/TSEL_017468.t1
MSFAGGRQVQPGQLRTMVPAAQRRMKPAVGKVVNTLRSALEELQKEGVGREPATAGYSAGDGKHTTQYLCAQVKALQKGFSMLADAVLDELETVREESRKWQTERDGWMSTMTQLRDSVEAKLEEFDRAKDDMEHWKLGATDVLAKARQELVSTSVQPLESRLSEVSTVLSGVVKNTSNAQLAVLNLENRLDSHVKEYTADKASDRDTIAAVRTYVDSSEREAYSVSEALAGDVAKLNEDVKGLQIMQQNLAQQNPAVDALKEKISLMMQHQGKHAKSMEDIVRNLLADTQSLSKKSRSMDNRLTGAESAVADTYEALARSSQVFSAALKIPSPIPAGSPMGVGYR